MTGSDKANETQAAAPDALLKTGKDATIELLEKDLESVSGGGGKTDNFKQMQDVTNNQQTTAQKAADKADQYIRS